MLDSFIIASLIAGMGIATVTGVMGCFVVWRRMAYFGDSLAHSAILGVALGIAFGLGAGWGIIAICGIFAALLFILQTKSGLHSDTLLGILAHSGLALGVIAISVAGIRIDLHALLFGDILTVTPADIAFIYGGGAAVLVAIVFFWQSLVLLALDPDLARAEGIRTRALNFLFLALMVLVVAVAIRLVGALLLTSLLIIPAATARLYARSPEAMAGLAILTGWLGVAAGLGASFAWDVPTGPGMVAALSVFFALSMILKRGILKNGFPKRD